MEKKIKTLSLLKCKWYQRDLQLKDLPVKKKKIQKAEMKVRVRR